MQVMVNSEELIGTTNKGIVRRLQRKKPFELV